MKYKILCGCAVFALAVVTTSAQTKNTFSGNCAKPDVQQSIPAGDQDGHVFMLAQATCTVKGEVSGAAGKEAKYSEHGDATGKHNRSWGVFVETFDSGDKIIYSYQNNVASKENGTSTGSNKYQITGGTGKMKGVKGSGTCKLTGNADGGVDYTCTGEYILAGAAPAKK